MNLPMESMLLKMWVLTSMLAILIALSSVSAATVGDLQCSGKFPLLMESKESKKEIYGDICRKANYPEDKNWRCPKDCVATSDRKKPFCQKSRKNNAPCDISKGKPCYDYQCANGGSCGEVNGTPKCYCPPGFTGNHCEKTDVCADYECANGGTCIENDGTPKCNCPNGVTGNNCRKKEKPKYSACLESCKWWYGKGWNVNGGMETIDIDVCNYQDGNCYQLGPMYGKSRNDKKCLICKGGHFLYNFIFSCFKWKEGVIQVSAI